MTNGALPPRNETSTELPDKPSFSSLQLEDLDIVGSELLARAFNPTRQMNASSLSQREYHRFQDEAGVKVKNGILIIITCAGIYLDSTEVNFWACENGVRDGMIVGERLLPDEMVHTNGDHCWERTP